MLSSAAAKTGDIIEPSSSVWSSPTLWVAVSFFLFLLIFSRPAWVFFIGFIDNKIEEIRAKIDEATKLREEAQDILATNKRKIVEAEKEAEVIIAEAREEAQLLKTKLMEELAKSVERRQKMATDRISQAEAEAVESIRLLTIETALKATEQVLKNNLSDIERNKLIDGAIEDLSNKLN